MVVSPKRMGKSVSVTRRRDFKIVNSVFDRFIFSLFCENQSNATDRLCSTRFLRSGMFCGASQSRNWASSAYITVLPCGMCCGKSFVYSRNSTGPSIEPCTTLYRETLVARDRSPLDSLCSLAEPSTEPPLIYPVPPQLLQEAAMLDTVKCFGCICSDE